MMETDLDARKEKTEQSVENSLQFLRKVNVHLAYGPESQGFTPEK